MLRNWKVIVALTIVGVGLGYYWWQIRIPAGVTPQGNEDFYAAIAALAGAITTLGTAIFGMLGKWADYKKTKLEIEEKQLELNQKKAKAQSAE